MTDAGDEGKLRRRTYNAVVRLAELTSVDVESLKTEFLPHLDQLSWWQGVVEERRLAKRCGLPTCSKSIDVEPSMDRARKPNQLFKIDRADGAIYATSTTDRAKFCSRRCLETARRVANQLWEQPLWVCPKREARDFQLDATEGCSKEAKKEVRFVRADDATEMVVTKLEHLYIGETAEEDDEDGASDGAETNDGDEGAGQTLFPSISATAPPAQKVETRTKAQTLDEDERLRQIRERMKARSGAGSTKATTTKSGAPRRAILIDALAIPGSTTKQATSGNEDLARVQDLFRQWLCRRTRDYLANPMGAMLLPPRLSQNQGGDDEEVQRSRVSVLMTGLHGALRELSQRMEVRDALLESRVCSMVGNFRLTANNVQVLPPSLARPVALVLTRLLAEADVDLLERCFPTETAARANVWREMQTEERREEDPLFFGRQRCADVWALAEKVVEMLERAEE